MNDAAGRIARNVAEVRGRIAEAAARSGRRADEVRLLAVTKYVELPEIRALVAVGCHDLGESRPQQLWDRAAALAAASPRPPLSERQAGEGPGVRASDPAIHWHLIGHLQRNKVRRTLPLVSLIHSVDSLRLAQAIDEEARLLGHRAAVLLEINVSAEAAKTGFAPAEVELALPALAELKNLDLRGLMCMAGLEGGPDEARREFAALRCLRDRLRGDLPAELRFDELSMGMSGDYEAAIEEGATIVRIGSALVE